jgi:hypothetical protein
MHSKLLPIGTRVKHSGHGLGAIVDHNGSAKNVYVEQNLGSPEVGAAVQAGLGAAIIGSFYSGDRFPYVVTYDSGYTDVYAATDFVTDFEVVK